MADTKEKPIAILTVNENISKMSKAERQNLCRWLRKQAQDIRRDYKDYGKCNMRLMR